MNLKGEKQDGDKMPKQSFVLLSFLPGQEKER